MNSKKGQGFKFNFYRGLSYLGWGSIMLFLELLLWQYQLVYFYSILILLGLNSFFAFIIEVFFGKFLYKGWWSQGSKPSLVNGMTCGCAVCNDWRNSLGYSIYIRRLLPTIVIVGGISVMSFIFPKTFYIGISEELVDVKNQIRNVDSTTYYAIRKIPNEEIVKGQKGSYYKIQLKNASYNEKILFPPGEFTIDESEDRLIIPLNNFIDSVFRTIAHGTKCKLYVRGRADILGHTSFEKFFEKIPIEKKSYEMFYILSKVEDYYINQEKVITIPNPYHNEDLPNLRARFIQLIFENIYKEFSPPQILEGEIVNKVDEYDRNAYLFLFVDWTPVNSFWNFPKWVWCILLLIISGLSSSIKWEYKDGKLKPSLELKFTLFGGG